MAYEVLCLLAAYLCSLPTFTSALATLATSVFSEGAKCPTLPPTPMCFT